MPEEPPASMRATTTGSELNPAACAQAVSGVPPILAGQP
jgi:hypothetical protein